MGLIGNANRLNGYIGKQVGLAQDLSIGARNTRSDWYNLIRADGASTILNTAAKPTGYYDAALFLPLIQGEMTTSAGGVYGDGDLAATIAGGKNAEAALSGSGSLTASLSLIVSLLATLSGSSSVSATLLGAGNASAALSGTGTLTASVSAIGHLIAALQGDGDVVAAISALGHMEADITVTGATLTTANVGAAVLAAVLEGSLDVGEVLRILLAVAAGKSAIDIGPPVHVTFRDQADTKDRVDAEMSGSERVSVTLDGE